MYSVDVVMVVVVGQLSVPESVDCATVSCHRILRRGQSTISERKRQVGGFVKWKIIE